MPWDIPFLYQFGVVRSDVKLQYEVFLAQIWSLYGIFFKVLSEGSHLESLSPKGQTRYRTPANPHHASFELYSLIAELITAGICRHGPVDSPGGSLLKSLSGDFWVHIRQHVNSLSNLYQVTLGCSGVCAKKRPKEDEPVTHRRGSGRLRLICADVGRAVWPDHTEEELKSQ